MSEEKRKRIIAAITVNAVILVFIIVAVIIYQIVQICVLSARLEDSKAELAEIMQDYEEAKELGDFVSVEENKQLLVEYLVQTGQLDKFLDGLS